MKLACSRVGTSSVPDTFLSKQFPKYLGEWGTVLELTGPKLVLVNFSFLVDERTGWVNWGELDFLFVILCVQNYFFRVLLFGWNCWFC